MNNAGDGSGGGGGGAWWAGREAHERLELARELVRLARGVILGHYSPLGVRFERKADGSPVTVADRAAEELIRRELARRCPEDGVLGEEFGEEAGRSDVRWVLDPIDGTRAFTHGVPLFGCMVSIERRVGGEWRPIASVVDFPALDEVCWAHMGSGAWHAAGGGEGRLARVSPVDRLAEAVVTMTTPRTPWQVVGARGGGAGRMAEKDREGQEVWGVVSAARDVRGWGDCHAHVMVATGRLEAMVNGPVGWWDVSPLEPILLEAGGRVSDWWGGAAGDGSRGLVSSNGLVHAELIGMLRGG